MKNIQYVGSVEGLIEKQEKEMKEGLHKVGKHIYSIFEKSMALSKCLPNVFHQKHFRNDVSFKNNDFSYSVDSHLNQSITLTFHGKYNFTYREIKKDESSNWEICLSDLDDNVTAVDIYTTVWNLLEWLNNYSSQNEERIKAIIDGLENM